MTNETATERFYIDRYFNILSKYKKLLYCQAKHKINTLHFLSLWTFRRNFPESQANISPEMKFPFHLGNILTKATAGDLICLIAGRLHADGHLLKYWEAWDALVANPMTTHKQWLAVNLCLRITELTWVCVIYFLYSGSAMTSMNLGM